MDYLNVIVDNGNVHKNDEKNLFGPLEHKCKGCPRCYKEKVLHVPIETTMFDLLVKLGSFKSKGQARKNWRFGKDIPSGWSEFKIGKLKRHLSIWNPEGD
jgi:hypothetical protein